jgi:hypothetical protein
LADTDLGSKMNDAVDPLEGASHGFGVTNIAAEKFHIGW